ncbi:MAG: hypothetical protein KGZ88_11860 [Methylomicrobium sp.]|nr:hypothetical protein [Methylomicrobium sp.]
MVAKDGLTGQCFYSKLKEIIRADANLIKFALPVNEMIHDESLELINGWDFKDTSSLKMIRDCGVAIVSTSGVPIKMYACFVTLGTVLTGAPYLTQSSATDATTSTFTHVNIGETFCINELVQIYSDPNGDGSAADGYDRRAYAKLFLREYGYTYTESSNADIGYPALTYKKYNFPLTHVVDAGVVANDATVDSALPYTGMSIQWYGTDQSRSLGANGPYNFRVIINANSSQNATHDQVYTFVQRQLRRTADIDAGAGVRTGNVASAIVFMDGATLKTIHQAGVGGVHVDNLAASSRNNIAEADNTQAYRTYPFTAAITLEFDSFLVADAGPAKFWLFDAATYGTSGATIINDADGVPITGNVTGASMSFSYAYSVDKPVVGLAVGKADAKIAIAATTIAQSTANKATFVAGQERWYANPA